MKNILNATDLQGCFVALATPVANNERLKPEINYTAMDKLVKYVLQANVHGIVVSGCTGAAYGFSIDEQVKLNAEINKKYGRDTRVIAGDGGNCTWEVIEIAKRIESEAGIFTHLMISPYYNKPSNKGIIQHYLEIANSIEGNIILYSVNSRTGGKGITLDIVKELWQHPHIIGIKDASGNLERIASMIEATSLPKFSVLSGDDGLALKIIRLGARGHISAVGNIVPNEMADIINYARIQRYAEAEEINNRITPLYHALFPKDDLENPSPNPSTTHYALRRIGFDVGVPRLPLEDCEPHEIRSIDDALEKVSLIKNIAN